MNISTIEKAYRILILAYYQYERTPPCRVKIAQKGNIKSNKIEMNLMHFIK